MPPLVAGRTRRSLQADVRLINGRGEATWHRATLAIRNGPNAAVAAVGAVLGCGVVDDLVPLAARAPVSASGSGKWSGSVIAARVMVPSPSWFQPTSREAHGLKTKVTIGAPGETMSSAPVSRYPGH